MFASFWNMNHNITCTRKILMKFKVTDDYMILQLIFKLTTYDCSGTNIRILRLPYRLKKTRQQVSYVQKINQFKVPKNHWWRKRPTWQCRLVAPTSKTGMPPGLSRRMKRWTFLFWSSLTWSNVSFPNLNQDQVQSDHVWRCTSNCWTFYTQRRRFNLQRIQVLTILTEVMSSYAMSI